ncbi:plasmid mobilization relaxosome protein MobC [Bradyrhizobium sp.]
MARPIKHEKRDRQLNLKLTRREFDWICARSARQALRPVDYVRAQLLADRPIRSPAKQGHLDPLFLLQLSRLGNNLNQIARRLNVMRLAAPEGLVPLLEEIRNLIRKGAADGS